MDKKQQVYAIIEKHYRANFSTLVKRYSFKLNGRHNAEDMLQEAYARALQYHDAFDVNEEFGRWFSGICVNCISDKLKEIRNKGVADEGGDEGEEHPVAINRLWLRDIEATLAKEPENVRRILTLYFFKQYKSKEIAKLVPEKHGNIRQIIHVFREKMKHMFPNEKVGAYAVG